MPRNRLRLVLLIAVAALVLGVASTAVLAAAGPARIARHVPNYRRAPSV